MKKDFIKKIKKKLEEKKSLIEKELKRFAKKDKKLKGDWNTRFPKFDSGASGGKLEDEAKEVEEYSTLLPIEFSLETRLEDIDLALKKIEKGKYGICEKCDKSITEGRLNACPEARNCLECQK